MLHATTQSSQSAHGVTGSPPRVLGNFEGWRTHVNLIICGGTVVTPGDRLVPDVTAEGGQVTQVSGPMEAEQAVDARRQYMPPADMDMHVHLTPAVTAEGITTVGNMTFPRAGKSSSRHWLAPGRRRFVPRLRFGAAEDVAQNPSPLGGVVLCVAHVGPRVRSML